MPAPPHRRLWPLIPLLALLLLLLLWDWNWFKPLIERQASVALGQTVLVGNLEVHLSGHPELVLTRITLANPKGFTSEAAPLARIRRLSLRFALRDLFDRRLRISQLDIDQPVATLRAGTDGQRNWQLRLPPQEPGAKPWTVEIEALSIQEGQFSLRDAVLKADISGTLHTAAQGDSAESRLVAAAEGRYRDQPFTARFVGGSALRLRTPQHPYPVDFQAQTGTTRMLLKGSLLDPLHFAGANLRLFLQGPDLSALADLTGLPLPNTPAYRLEGDLDYQARSIRFKNFSGLMGESDLAGDLKVHLGQSRPRMEATVRSRQVRLADLSGLIGGNPNAIPAATPGGDVRVLPSTAINLPRLKAADVKLDFEGAHIVGDALPFDRLAFKLSIDDGVMRLSPVDFGIGDGSLRFYATLDPRGEQLALDGTAELRRVDVSRLMQKTGYAGSGRIGGFARLKGKGRSAAELLGHGNGELKLAMAGGDFSALLLDLSGLDFGNAVLSAVGFGKRTEVRCLVGDFALHNGLLDTRSFVLDTGNTNLLLNGSANLRDESLDLRLSTRPKRANIGRLKAPIHISGRFSDPHIHPDYMELGLRSAAVVALGTLLTPLAALLPTLQLGPGEDRDCQALLSAASVSAPPQPLAR